MNHTAWMRRLRLPLAATAAAVLAACGGGGAAPEAAAPTTAAQAAGGKSAGSGYGNVAMRGGDAGEANGKASRLYLVQLAESPVSAYTGGIAGYKATKPAAGKKLDSTNPDVVSYSGYLKSRHDTLLAAVGSAKKAYSYAYVFNGFAAELSDAQVAKLAAMPGVLAVSRDEARKLDTATTPAFLGLSGPGGAWSTFGVKGEGVVIGIVDGGAWPEHPSLSDRVGANGNLLKDGKLGYQQLPGWNGKCTPGEEFNASDCNQKLIGAQYFNAGWGGNAGIDAQLPWEFNSPRDYGGHGTHVATTAGGNENVAITGQAAPLGRMSGIAPRARIAAYKVCWQTEPGGGGGGSCFNSDSVAAIDQAVADGVDVINFSVSGSQTSFRDPVEIAFLFAADAGVFVATSAGNAGPTASTVAHPGPWVTTVAAGTHNRDGAGSVTLGNGATYSGASLATAAVTAPLIYAGDAALPGANLSEVALCYSSIDGTSNGLDPAKVTGKIVVCDRGATARVNKSLAVKEAGGVGMVLVNPSTNSLNADFHAVPSVHLQATDRPAVLAYAATSGATATIAKGVVVDNAPAPFTASFSSRGPLRAGAGDLLKPDVIAPGQDILAGVAPPGNFNESFALYSGTSMSSPHVAGLGALFKQKYPAWSPARIKSALMTTAYDTIPTGIESAPGQVQEVAEDEARRIFRQGAGHVLPAKAFRPGVVYDAGFGDWLAFICGVQPGGGCTGVTPIDPSNLNVASIAVGDLAGTQTVRRTVTNVSGKALTLRPTMSGLAGFDVSVTPGVLEVPANGKASYAVTITRTSAPLNAYTGGQLTWTDSEFSVRSPVVVRPVALAAPAALAAAAGGSSYEVTFGYTGPFTATARGLVPATVTPGTVAQDPDQEFDPADATGTVAIPVTIPAGSTYVRLALFDADVSTGSDLDLYVYLGTTLVGASTTGTSAEEVNFSFSTPTAAPINLVVYVHGWGAAGGSSPFKLHQWSVGTADAGNMTISAPAAATLGASGTVSLSFGGLMSGEKYLGAVVYGGADGMPSPTIVRVDAP